MNLRETPSATEFVGFYNVLVDQSSENSEEYLNTTWDVPPLTLEEVVEVGNAARKIISRYANQWWFTPDEAQRYYWGSICLGLEDRTLNLSFYDNDDITLEMIEQLQKLLKKKHPLWRIRILASSPETTIIIYPNIVRYGSLSPEMDDDQAFATVMALEKTIDKNISGKWLKTHREILQRVFRSVIVRGLEKRVVFPILFDNYCGDFTKITVWSLCAKDTSDLELVGYDEVPYGYEYRVKPNGDFGFHVGDDAPYWTKAWIFPKDQLPTRLIVKAYHTDYESEIITVDIQPLEVINEFKSTNTTIVS
ncbi:MAG: hypothetical protein WHU94_09000 [Thermogemmata sp.]|uniref:Uncharacterized protein n=1 Tax=Thermogemmata fonticola TaxID=2755323 RepID=A0A7V9AB35_9BACT|nr:hypothetical protein [Thermogemmata fonticola]MBA2225623.1 hypothetical protein [Thermogemmata fonticola]